MDAELRTIFRKRLPKVHWSSIETGPIEPGVPDSHGCCEGTAFWIEYKKTTAMTVAVHESQVAWHTAHAHFGGRSFFAVRRIRAKSRNLKEMDELLLVRGAFALGLRTYGLTGVPLLGFWSGGPARWKWEEILKHLLAPLPKA